MWLLDEAGSAMNLGHQALARSLLMADGRLPETGLRDQLWARLGATTPQQIKAFGGERGLWSGRIRGSCSGGGRGGSSVARGADRARLRRRLGSSEWLVPRHPHGAEGPPPRGPMAESRRKTPAAVHCTWPGRPLARVPDRCGSTRFAWPDEREPGVRSQPAGAGRCRQARWTSERRHPLGKPQP